MVKSNTDQRKPNGLLRGPTAYTLFAWAFLLWAAFMVDLMVTAILTFLLWGKFDVLSNVLEVVSLALIASFIGAALAGFAKMKKEIYAGYTTLPWSTESISIRDPKTGNLLRLSGEALPKGGRYLTFRLLRAEEHDPHPRVPVGGGTGFQSGGGPAQRHSRRVMRVIRWVLIGCFVAIAMARVLLALHTGSL